MISQVEFPNRAALFSAVNSVLAEYSNTQVTVRQLYYRLVARGAIPNNIRAYKNLGAALTDWRRNHKIDIGAFSDRTRGMIKEDVGWREDNPDTWTKLFLEDAITNCEAYHLARWYNQENKVTVFVEKQALEGPFREVCSRLDVDLAVCRGYPSLSFLKEASDRLDENDGRRNVVLYFGDLDPSGLNIPETVERDLVEFFGHDDLVFRRVALTENQVREFNLIPAPVKTGDSRSSKFILSHGTSVYELDAIEPKSLQSMIESSVLEWFDAEVYEESLEIAREGREKIARILKESGIKSLVDRLGGGA